MFQNDALTVQQTWRGCLQQCLGCEPRSEYRIYPGHIEQGQARAEGIPQIGHLLEESSCIIRNCCGVMRKFDMPLTEGAPEPNGQLGRKVATYHKPWSFPTCCIIYTPYGNIIFPCCCHLPQLNAVAPDGRSLGHTQYVCDPSDGNCCCAVPMYHVFDESGALKYIGKHHNHW